MVDRAWVGRVVTPALYFHAAICVFAAVFLFYGGMDATAAVEPVFARQSANLLLGYVAMAVLVTRRFRADARWLLIPIFFTCGEWATWVSQAVAAAVGIPVVSGLSFAAPLVVDSILLPLYVVSYLTLRRAGSVAMANGASSVTGQGDVSANAGTV
jgi:hypothetical protein